MRFIAGGPSIPDELLMARDAGEVLFFCGAGVSMADARLPDFPTLAERVLLLLGSAADSAARRLFEATRKFERDSGLTGLVATDRIFGMLEREFDARDVREAVAIALRPKPECKLQAHRILLDLSRSPTGVPRLVTTNFDRLFEACEEGLDSYNPPRLPDPNRPQDFKGIIHLHGRVDEEYTAACDDEFVLSSADFGHAYLSDGWATRYIQALLKRFRIVFVGYSADDPPVQYLLEALNRFARPAQAMYAFQAGEAREAAAQWVHKGVQPISYSSADRHSSLWETLAAWARRARDPDGWHDSLLHDASAGPIAMEPFRRGMIAHVASTRSGAGLLARSPCLLPAEWLFVFDRTARYERPGRAQWSEEASDRFDPFQAYGIDSDSVPPPIDPQNFFADRAVPEDSWDAFDATDADRERLPAGAVARVCGDAHQRVLPSRLLDLGVWIKRIAHQPAALWWAAGKKPLHHDIQNMIEWEQKQQPDLWHVAVRDGWRLLLLSWRQHRPGHSKYSVEEDGKRYGWSLATVRAAVALYCPLLEVRSSFRTQPPQFGPDVKIEDLVHIDVEYSRPPEPVAIPDDMLVHAVPLLRRQIEDGIALEQEIGRENSIYLDTLRGDTGHSLGEDAYGVTGYLVTYTNWMRRLSGVDPQAVNVEIARWEGDDKVSIALRVWAAGDEAITTAERAGAVMTSLDDDAFWSGQHERDLLFAMRDRWAQLPRELIHELEQRLLKGCIPWTVGRPEEQALAAYQRLCRLHWLSTRGVHFTFDYQEVVASLRKLAPDWTDSAADIAQPRVGNARSVLTDTSPGVLSTLPLEEVLEQAEALSNQYFNQSTQLQPYRGLIEQDPARAWLALGAAARRGRFYSSAWASILASEGGGVESPRMLDAIAMRLCRLSAPQLREIVYSAAAWINRHARRLVLTRPTLFDKLWAATLGVLAEDRPVRLGNNGEKRWVDDALNSPVRSLSDAVFQDPLLEALKPGQGFPDSLKRRLNSLLGLPVGYRQHAIVCLARRLGWLFYIDPGWIIRTFLPIAGCTYSNGSPDFQGYMWADDDPSIGLVRSEDMEAFWAGYFSGGRAPQPELLQVLRPKLMELARGDGLSREQARMLANMLMVSWVNGKGDAQDETEVSDADLHELLIAAGEAFRGQVLWLLRQWAVEPQNPAKGRLLKFVRTVWPRQRALRTSRMSAYLVDLAFCVPDLFAEVVDAILPRLTVVEGDFVLAFHSNIDLMSSTHPRSLLALVLAILGEDPARWPDGVSEVLAQLAENPETKSDLRLAELLRRKGRR